MSNCNTITKSELTDLCEVSISKVRKWCNVDFYEELKLLGYQKRQNIFTPRQTEFLKRNLVEFLE